MTTVALVGPDGAGKTTVARRLEGALEIPVRYLYMGVSADSSNVDPPDDPRGPTIEASSRRTAGHGRATVA